MKVNRLLTGTLALVLIAGFVSPAFADVSEYGEIDNDEGIDFGNPNEVEEIALPAVAVNLATNGDFETGDFTGWTQFTTANGITNPAVVPFDTDGDTVATNSAQFSVGEIVFLNVGAGGGIFQTITTGGGTVTIIADIAAQEPDDIDNAEGGVFTLFFDGAAVDSHSFGNIAGNTIERATLFAVINGVSPGNHEVKLQMTRDFLENVGTPKQYIDDVMVLAEPFVGGELLPIDSTALMLAGLQSSAIWMLPVLAGAAGATAIYLKSRKN